LSRRHGPSHSERPSSQFVDSSRLARCRIGNYGSFVAINRAAVQALPGPDREVNLGMHGSCCSCGQTMHFGGTREVQTRRSPHRLPTPVNRRLPCDRLTALIQFDPLKNQCKVDRSHWPGRRPAGACAVGRRPGTGETPWAPRFHFPIHRFLRPSTRLPTFPTRPEIAASRRKSPRTFSWGGQFVVVSHAAGRRSCPIGGQSRPIAESTRAETYECSGPTDSHRLLPIHSHETNRSRPGPHQLLLYLPPPTL
jgi:hypothetical protein